MARAKKGKTLQNGQTLTAVARIVNLSDHNVLILGLLAFFATKLWNVASNHRRSVWQTLGKIPDFFEQCKLLKVNRWYKLLPSQSAQEVLGEQDDSYRSWFSLRKNGDKKANPPGFRKKDLLSAVTFKQKAFRILPGNKLELHLPKTFSSRRIVLEFLLSPNVVLGKVQQLKLVYVPVTGDWMVHFTHVVKVEYRTQGNIMSLDLGIINIIAGLVSNGFSFLVPGGVLLALDRYFHRENSKCRSAKSQKCRNLNRSRVAQGNFTPRLSSIRT